MPEMNWSENVEFAAAQLATPTTIAELQETVAEARRVKGLGSRHSFNRIADTGGVQISTAALDLPASVDHDAMVATVPGGWTYGEVAVALESQGVALANMASLPHISVAGGTATGTHGSGNTCQILAAEICALELVTADGSLRTIDRSMPEFGALAVGLGAFGIITTVTFDVQPTYIVSQHIYEQTSWSNFLGNLDDVMASAYSVNVHASFSHENIRKIWQKDRVAFGADGRPRIANVPDELVGAKRLDVVDIEPGRVTTITTPGPWHERLPHFVANTPAPSVGGDELQSEYFVDRTNAVHALEALRAMGERIDPHLWGSEIRSVAADDLWLSPAVGRDCLSIGFTWKKHPPDVLALLPDIEAALRPFEPTAQWGKLFTLSRADLIERHPRLDDFLALATDMDPTGKFMNSYLQRLTNQEN